MFSSGQVSFLTKWVVRGTGHKGRFSRNPLPVFSAGGHCERFWHGQGSPLFDVVHPASPLPTMASFALQVVPKDGFGMAVVAGKTTTTTTTTTKNCIVDGFGKAVVAVIVMIIKSV